MLESFSRTAAWSGVLTLAIALGATAASPSQEAAGTYSVQVCRSVCTGLEAKPYLTGTVVLLERPVLRKDGKPINGLFVEGPVNGCFKLPRLQARDDTYAGIDAEGPLSWQIDDSGTLRFPLYRSADAGYEVELKPGPHAWSGTGHSWGAGAAEIHAPVDQVVATRTGAAAQGQCPPIPHIDGR